MKELCVCVKTLRVKSCVCERLKELCVKELYVTKLCGTKLCVCVWQVCIDVKLHIIYSILTWGVTGVPGGSVTNEDTSPGPV